MLNPYGTYCIITVPSGLLRIAPPDGLSPTPTLPPCRPLSFSPPSQIPPPTPTSIRQYRLHLGLHHPQTPPSPPPPPTLLSNHVHLNIPCMQHLAQYWETHICPSLDAVRSFPSLLPCRSFIIQPPVSSIYQSQYTLSFSSRFVAALITNPTISLISLMGLYVTSEERLILQAVI